VRCTGVKGTVDLRGRGTDVDLDKISGEVTISGDYTGTVSLRELSKPVRVASTRTELDLQKVPGEVRLDRGSLNMQDVVGPVKLVARSTDISLSGYTDGLDLTVDRGDVDLRPDRVPLGKIAVHARSGDIELSLPQQANFVLNANTRHGDIDNQFGEMLRQQTEGHGAKLEGTVGKGPDLMLETGRGNITVRKATGQEAPKTTGSRATAPVQQAGLSLVSPANQ
jgi:DUF4097 and DUF4098 domain-containing protein YvlB